MKIKSILLLTVFYFFFCGCANFKNKNTTIKEKTSSQNRTPANLELFLLIGQSNMAGRAVIEKQDRDTLENVFLFTGHEENKWEKAANPLNKYSTVRKQLSMQRLGPGYTFAKKIAEAFPEKRIGLVVNAKGGTSIAKWKPGSELYNEAIKRAKEAMPYGTFKGVLWHQGEGDVKNTNTYLENISELILSIRSDLGISELPFIAGQLSETKPGRAAFNQMIIHLPEKVQATGVATTDGLNAFDSTHFNSESQRLMGERYAREILKFKRK